MEKNYHFKTHSDLKNIIGQDLINDDNIAIIELIKNSIDALSKNIDLVFSKEPNSIIITDNGHGMSLFDLENKWLNIAYSDKKNKEKNKRVMAGNKGVGRFACDRLGQRLDIFTKTKDEEPLHLSLNWKEFENLKDFNDSIQGVDIIIKKTSSKDIIKFTDHNIIHSGTILLITELRQAWGNDKLLSLKRNLQNFVNPIAVFDEDSVNIKLEAKHFLDADKLVDKHLRINGVIENTVFSKLKFNTTYIESNISENGENITTSIWHEGNRVYRIKERNVYHNELKNISVILHYLNSYKKSYFKR